MGRGMTLRSVSGAVTRALADATDRSEDEMRLIITVAAIVGGGYAAVRLLNHLVEVWEDLSASASWT